MARTTRIPRNAPPPPSSSSASPPRAASTSSRSGRGDDGRPRRAQPADRRPPHHDPPRAGRRVHGRRPRAADRAGGGRHGDPRAGRDQPRHRHRRRIPRPRPDGRHHRPDRSRQAPQGVAPVRRHRAHVRARDKWNQRVELAGAVPEIVRKAFRVAQLEKPGPTHIELPENLAAAPVADDLGPIQPTQAYFPEPTDEAIEHAARLLAGSTRPLVLAGNGVLRRDASASCAPSPRASTCRSPPRSWARAPSTTGATSR